MKYKRFFVIMLLMILLQSISVLLPALFLLAWQQQNQILSQKRIMLLVAIISGSTMLTIGLTFFREHYAKSFNERNFRSMLDNALNMDYDTIITMGPANILERISDSVNKIYSYMTGDCIDIWANIITILACLILTASVTPWIATLLLIMVPVNYWGYRMLNKELTTRSKELSEQTSQGFQEILSCMQQVDYMKQTADHSRILCMLSPSIEKLYKSMARINVYAQSASAGLRGLNDVVRIFILMTIVYRFFSNNSGPYTLIMTSVILPLYFSKMGAIVGAKLNQTGFKVASNYQKELLLHKEANGTILLSEISSVCFDVGTLFVQGKTIPFDAHCSLKKGDIVQVCGPSGCGKSTFVKALLKFRPIDGITYNDIPIAEIDNRTLRQRVEYLSQNVPIIQGTLRDNLFLNTVPTKEMETRLLNEPMLQSIFATKSFDSKILEAGANLSGGEKQKIALARALFSNADVLILDEVCSNIDKETANAIYECLQRERSKRITIIISHEQIPEGLVNVKINESRYQPEPI